MVKTLFVEVKKKHLLVQPTRSWKQKLARLLESRRGQESWGGPQSVKYAQAMSGPVWTTSHDTENYSSASPLQPLIQSAVITRHIVKVATEGMVIQDTVSCCGYNSSSSSAAAVVAASSSFSFCLSNFLLLPLLLRSPARRVGGRSIGEILCMSPYSIASQRSS